MPYVTNSDIAVEKNTSGNGAKYYASWTSDALRKHEFLGCPLGRGNSPEGAISNLINRTEGESRVVIILKRD